MVIQHNLTAMNSNRQFGIVAKTLAGSTEKLSSGYKINRAADDAAGLSISEKMRKQIRGLSKATENAEDGISLAQIADGALEEVHEMLQRINELSVKSANGTNSDSDREAIQAEVDQLKTEIDRVAETTKFNELYLLKGKQGAGSSASGSSPLITMSDVDDIAGTKIIFVDEVITTPVGIPVASNDNTFNTVETQLANVLKTSVVPQAVSSFINTLDAFDYLDGSVIKMGLKIENDSTSTTLASVGVSPRTVGSSNILGYTLTVNMASLLDGAGNLDLSASKRNNLEVTIVHEMMHAFMDEALTNGMTSGTDRFPHWFIEGMAQSVAGGCYNGNDWINRGLGLTASSTKDQIKNKITSSAYSLAGNTQESWYSTGYLATMYLAYKAGSGGALQDRLTEGVDIVLADIMNGKSLDEVIDTYTNYAGLADFTNNFGKQNDELAFISSLLGAVGNSGSGGLITGFSNVTGVLNDSDLNGITLFELDTTKKLVFNLYPAGYDVFSGGSATNGGSSLGINISRTLERFSSRTANIALHLGADADMTNKLVMKIDAMDCNNLNISDLDVLTETTATSAIKRIEKAIAKVSQQRSAIGAYQNRLEHTVKNLDNIIENTTASESAIRDTDMATEMVKYSNSQILAQAGQSMLAQSNQKNNGVLALLG